MRYRTQKPRLLGLLLSMTMLVGCGFHLRGMVDIPSWLTNVTIIIEQADRNIASLLKEQLEAYHLRVNPNPATSDYWLIIEQDDTQQQIASISSSTTPRQYRLVYSIRFKLQRAQAEEIIPSTTLNVTRQVTINGDRILGSNDEEALLITEMKREAITRIINRLSRSLPDTQPARRP